MNDQPLSPNPTFPSMTPEEKSAQVQAAATANVEQAQGGVPIKKFNLPFAIVSGLVVIIVVFGVFSQAMKKGVTPSPEVQSGEPTQSDVLMTNEEEDLAQPPELVVTKVQLTTPVAESVVSSPLAVAGTVPPGWMFEGQLTIRLEDDQKQIIIEAPGTEVYPGNWQSGEPVDFSGALIFTTSAVSGSLVIAKPNPSGLPENDDSFSIPVKFQ